MPKQNEDVVYEALRAWRNRLAKRRQVRPFRIFSNRELKDIACTRPTDENELLLIHGVGEIKLSRYGKAVLKTLRGFSGANGSARRSRPSPSASRGRRG